MSLKTNLKSYLAAAITSDQLLNARRRVHDLRRRLRGAGHVVHYFHDSADPYGALTAQILPAFQAKYGVKLCPHLISGPPSEAVPEPDAYQKNAMVDATRLALKHGLNAPVMPSIERIQKANRLFAAAIGAPDWTERLSEVSAALWTGHAPPDEPGADPTHAMAAGDRALASKGHYLGGTFFYGGEWYWGIDRLYYLEQRLQQAGLGGDPLIVPVSDPTDQPLAGEAQELEFFFSFRSPYSYLAFDRVVNLGKRHNARLILKPVLPMLMRGLPVPKAKSRYILRDCTREARRLGIPFGRICDPLGAGVERGYALFDYAEDQGKFAPYCAAFMRSVWSQGVDAATDRGMERIVTSAGLEWSVARPLLNTQEWRGRVEANQHRLQEVGLWGVPSFCVDGQSLWGQDRFWAVEDLLMAHRRR